MSKYIEFLKNFNKKYVILYSIILLILIILMCSFFPISTKIHKVKNTANEFAFIYKGKDIVENEKIEINIVSAKKENIHYSAFAYPGGVSYLFYNATVNIHIQEDVTSIFNIKIYVNDKLYAIYYNNLFASPVFWISALFAITLIIGIYACIIKFLPFIFNNPIRDKKLSNSERIAELEKQLSELKKDE